MGCANLRSFHENFRGGSWSGGGGVIHSVAFRRNGGICRTHTWWAISGHGSVEVEEVAGSNPVMDNTHGDSLAEGTEFRRPRRGRQGVTAVPTPHCGGLFRQPG